MFEELWRNITITRYEDEGVDMWNKDVTFYGYNISYPIDLLGAHMKDRNFCNLPTLAWYVSQVPHKARKYVDCPEITKKTLEALIEKVKKQ